jgi:hypothetical protein
MIGMSLARDLLGARQFPHFWHFRSLVRGSMQILMTNRDLQIVPTSRFATYSTFFILLYVKMYDTSNYIDNLSNNMKYYYFWAQWAVIRRILGTILGEVMRSWEGVRDFFWDIKKSWCDTNDVILHRNSCKWRHMTRQHQRVTSSQKILPWEESEALQKFEVFWEVVRFPRADSGFLRRGFGRVWDYFWELLFSKMVPKIFLLTAPCEGRKLDASKSISIRV